MQRNQLTALELASTVLVGPRVIYPTVIWDDQHVLLLDTGYQGQLELLKENLEKAGAPFDRLSHVLMTHHDLDHVGGLPALLAEAPREVEVFAQALEKPYIQGEKRFLRITDETLVQIGAWPEERRIPFLRMLDNPPKGPVSRVIAGGEELPFCGGIVVIDTPGHTPGHLSFYHKPTKTLIAGDAMVVTDAELYGPEPAAAIDLPLALQSLKAFEQFDIETVVCYHGGVYRNGANVRIAQLVADSEALTPFA
ncbi:MBL fold metallo-hydrolase [Paenibacillus albiflavus]|uniref:MBL fold metallo-hydrolase n=1 Tax=Paenibacillus albiflavus TaxID=2545760 RepID=A0A4R4E1S6_9BACL|nr:MBL fold metallo-hydrolase [Paenibacillus albiflavus]TCZ69017.1 MBL fold metallo-hydrolase [Paenibacillus albiflavus]